MSAVKYAVVEIDRDQITVDVSMLGKSGSMYFNATEMAKRYGKKPVEWLKQKDTQEYISALLEVTQTHFGNYDNLVKTRRGGKYQGTWLHNDLAIAFARWLDVRYAVQMDLTVKRMLEEEAHRKQASLEAKTGYLPLTDALRAAKPDALWHHYANENRLLCKLATGLSPKQLRKERGVVNAQDGMCAAELHLLGKLRRRDETYVEDGMDYEERKDRLNAFVERWSS